MISDSPHVVPVGIHHVDFIVSVPVTGKADVAAIGRVIRAHVHGRAVRQTASIGAIAAILGGICGIIGGYFVVSAGLRVAWAPNLATFFIPVALGVAAAVVAGIVGGFGAVPNGRGQMVRQLTA